MDMDEAMGSLSLDDLDMVSGGVRIPPAEVVGTVSEALGNSCFAVMLDNGDCIGCHVSGKLRMNYVRIMPGDRVKVELADGPYASRIVWRYKVEAQ